MDRRTWDLAKTAFTAARRAPADERSGIIRVICAGNHAARVEARRLLAHADEPRATGGRGRQGPGADGVPGTMGRFEIRGVLGSGATGRVFRAIDPATGADVALKVLRVSQLSDRAVRRMEYEAEILGSLSHPGIARVLEAGTLGTPLGPVPYIAMEYVDGHPVDEYARECALSDEDRIRLVAGACDAVGAAHARGIVHRDLKPAHLLVCAGGVVKVIDFGIARADLGVGGPTLLNTMSGDVLGTPAYMSPELARGRAHGAGPGTDVYSLGVILYELLLRRRCLDLSDLPVLAALEVVRGADPPLIGSCDRRYRGAIESVLVKAMHRDPERRYAAAGELAADLRRVLGGREVLAEAVSTRHRLHRAARRHRGVLIGSGVVVSVLLVVMGLLARAYAQDRREKEFLSRAIGVIGAQDPRLASSYAAYAVEHYGRVGVPRDAMRATFDAMGAALVRLEQFAGASDVYKIAYELTMQTRGDHDQQAIRSLQVWAESLIRAGDPQLALRLVEAELDWWGFEPGHASKRVEDSGDPTIVWQRLLRLAMTGGEAMVSADQSERAIAWLNGVYNAQIEHFAGVEDPDHSDIQETRKMLADLGVTALAPTANAPE